MNKPSHLLLHQQKAYHPDYIAHSEQNVHVREKAIIVLQAANIKLKIKNQKYYIGKKIKKYLTVLNLKGGPSKIAMVLSSDPVINRYGRAGRKSTLEVERLWPDKFPLDVPVSNKKTCPNLKYPLFIQKYILFIPFITINNILE